MYEGRAQMRRRRVLPPAWRAAVVPLLLLALGVPAAASQSPVQQGQPQQRPFRPVETAAALHRRQQNGCLANFYSCADQGSAFNGVCCQLGQSCALDANNQPACCPAK